MNAGLASSLLTDHQEFRVPENPEIPPRESSDPTHHGRQILAGRGSEQDTIQQTGHTLVPLGCPQRCGGFVVALWGHSQQLPLIVAMEWSREGWREPNVASAFQKGREDLWAHQPHLGP